MTDRERVSAELGRPVHGRVLEKYLADAKFRTALRRDCGLPPLPEDEAGVVLPPRKNKPLPGLLTQAANLAGSVFRHAMDGMGEVGEATYRLRLEVCGACPSFRDDSRCAECGCFMREKARWRTAECPLNKWGASAEPPPPSVEPGCGCQK